MEQDKEIVQMLRPKNKILLFENNKTLKKKPVSFVQSMLKMSKHGVQLKKVVTGLLPKLENLTITAIYAGKILVAIGGIFGR